jgi:hypothetical protein
MLYGLQCLGCHDDGCLSILSVVTIKINKISSNQRLTSINLSMLMVGLQGVSSDNVEVRSLVSALATKVGSCNESLNALVLSECRQCIVSALDINGLTSFLLLYSVEKRFLP